MQNSGVTLVAESMHISSAKDRTPTYANMSFLDNPPTIPPKNYASIISEDVWREFVTRRMDTCFQVIYNIQIQ